MQFAVPQFTDVEDKLIGPLTLKQFLFVFATGLVILMIYSLLKLSIFFFIFAIPVALIGLGISFGRFNGRPIYGYFGAFLNYLTKPQVRVFKREEMSLPTVKKSQTTPTLIQTPNQEEAESRLKKLAYILDKKSKEEEELIRK